MHTRRTGISWIFISQQILLPSCNHETVVKRRKNKTCAILLWIKVCHFDTTRVPYFSWSRKYHIETLFWILFAIFWLRRIFKISAEDSGRENNQRTSANVPQVWTALQRSPNQSRLVHRGQKKLALAHGHGRPSEKHTSKERDQNGISVFSNIMNPKTYSSGNTYIEHIQKNTR